MITADQLRNLLFYDPETGLFKWLDSGSGRSSINAAAGGVDSQGYIGIKINGRQFKAHRLAWLYAYGEFPPEQIDHINGVRDDNRLINLRAATNRINARNRKIKITNKSGVEGVNWHKRSQKWIGRIEADGRCLHLGCFIDWLDAVCARKAAEHKAGYHLNNGRR